MTYSEIKHILQQPYSLDTFKVMIDDIFPQTGKYLETQQPFEEHEKVNKGFQFGNITLADGKRVALFDVEVADNINITKNRKGLRDIAIKYIDNGIINGALVAFHSPNKADYRLSFMAKQAGFTEDGDFVTTQTAPKRYTFILGKNESCTTAAKRLAELKEKMATGVAAVAGLQAITDAFSVDKLNKEFFKGYKEHYEKFWKYINNQPNYREKLIDKEQTLQDKTEKPIRDFAKKLLGRIVFLYFLQKKGWMGVPADRSDWQGGDPNFIKNFFQSTTDKSKFYSTNLIELFYNTLNQVRKNDIFHLTATKVPYLNGGLFDNDSIETNHFDFPESYFSELFDFFDQFNFTIDENDPDDANVGIDPEMLGHIFENLLEENKDKGAFYTPKAIVQYMCQESLIQYLATAINADLTTSEELSNLIRHNDRGKPKGFVTQNAKKIEELLDTVKICDPAIGSGAFPMGMLQEIFKAKMTLDLTLDPAETKRHIIQNSIYGVDLERGAVDIARLRFWLALVVDEDTPSPLPNLDYKIMQGNSLLESFEGVPLHNLQQTQTAVTLIEGGQQLDIFGNVIAQQTRMEFLDTKKQDLDDLIDSFFDIDSQHKPAIKQQINDIVHEHLHYNVDLKLAEVETKIATLEDELSLININENDSKAKKEQKQKVLAIKQKAIENLQNEQQRLQNALLTLDRIQETNERPYFLWHLFFKDVFEQGGFDIVVGNPPYVRQERIDTKLKEKYQLAFPSISNGTADLYVYFFGIAFNIIKKKGFISYITLNKFLKTRYGLELRNILKTKQIHSIVDFFELPIFEASTDTAITHISNTQPYKEAKYFPVKTLDNLDLNKLITGSFLNIKQDEEDWKFIKGIEENIIQKIYQDTVSLKKFTEDKIFRGLVTGANGVFVLENDIAERLLTTESQEIVKPYAEPTAIKKWHIEGNKQYFLATGYDLNIPELYPSAYQYLLEHHEKLKNRQDQGKNWWNLRPCKYYEDFEAPKLIYIYTAKNHYFYYDTEGHYINNSAYMIVTEKVFLSSFLNSKLFNWFKRIKFVAYGDAEDRGRVKLDYNKMETLPIKNISEIAQKPFESLVNQILIDKKAGNDTIVLEGEIDRLIYELYELTEAEIAIVEGRG